MEWDKAASKKKCRERARKHNCITNNIEYHCVINEYANATLEVCATQRLILGHCAEFNSVGGVIQDHYLVPCNDSFPKCDKYYLSTDAYKYQDCYQLIKPEQITLSITTTVKSSTETDNSDATIIALIIVILVLTVFLMVIAVRYFVRHRTDENHTNNETAVHQDGTLLKPKKSKLSSYKCFKRNRGRNRK